MSNHQELLDLEMGTPPLSTVDVDKVIAGERRRRQYRQAGLSLLALGMTLGVTFGLVRGPSTDSGPTSGSPGPVATSAPAATPSTPSRRDQDEADLAAVVLDQLRANLPKASFAPSGHTVGPMFIYNKDGFYFGSVDITDSAGISSITVQVGLLTVFANERGCDAPPPDASGHPGCQTTPLPNGGLMRQATNGNGYMMVDVMGPDNKGVEITVRNAGGGLYANPYGNAPQRQGLPLTKDQVTAMAKDPRYIRIFNG